MTLDEDALVRWGTRIGAEVRPPVFIGLSGPLGAGKSVLARAIGRGAGAREAMPSPTFNLCFRYPGRPGVEVIHMDLYRLGSPDELWELGWEQLGGAGEVVLVEWPERAGDAMPEDHWLISLEVPEGEPGLRRVRVTRAGFPPPLPPFPLSVSP